MNDTQQPGPQAPHAGFCQLCGRGVVSEADRLAGKAFACGLCNEVKLAAPASAGTVYPGADTGAPGYSAAFDAGLPPVGSVPPGAVPPMGYAGKDAPNPGLAALLGLIPGVGAMYNGQYPKGIVHLLVFAILASLADANGIFGFLAFVWVCYQAIEAHHTARARRDGSPLPNPFGLNDIGERLGFGKAWPTYPATPSAGPVDQAPPNTSWSAQGTRPVEPFPTQQPPSTNWGGPWDTYRYQAPPVAPFPPHPPYAPYAPVGSGFGPGGGVDPPPFDPIRGGFEPPPPVGSRFPAGAIWMIALGTLFLLNTSGIFRGFSFRLLLPLFFIGLGVWQFVHKMTGSGLGMADDGSPAYRVRVFQAARGAVWLILLGVIFFLADFHILPWSRSWPLFLILAGVMTFLERSVYRGVSQPAYGYPANPMPYSAPYAAAGEPGAVGTPAVANPGTVTETSTMDAPTQEGR